MPSGPQILPLSAFITPEGREAQQAAQDRKQGRHSHQRHQDSDSDEDDEEEPELSSIELGISLCDTLR